MTKIKYEYLLNTIIRGNYEDLYYIAEDNKIVIKIFEHIVENDTEKYEVVSYFYQDIDVIDLILDLLETQKEMIKIKLTYDLESILEELKDND